MLRFSTAELNGVLCAMITGTTMTLGIKIGIAGEDTGREGSVCHVSMNQCQGFHYHCRSMTL